MRARPLGSLLGVHEPVGDLAVVLHAHLPWVTGHGVWPVGEEWLYQAWAESYLPLVEVLERHAGQGREQLLTLGVTPVLAAQLDDEAALAGMHAWLGRWQLRAHELAGRRDPVLRAAAAREHAAAERRLETFEAGWLAGGSPRLRPLLDAGAVELLGGPATHPFLPLLDPRVAEFALRAGLEDAVVRVGSRPSGIWVPECGYSPGLELTLAAAGVSHLCLDESALVGAGRPRSSGWRLGGSDVVAFARDLPLTDRVWSSRTGYPVGAEYRDFHARDEVTGLQAWAVTSPHSPDKAPYQPEDAAKAVVRDAEDFVAAVRENLFAQQRADRRRQPLAVVAWDAELFGHWWHEGPAFLDTVFSLLPQAGVRTTTLAGALARGQVGGNAAVGPTSWGAGKDFRVWAGDQVRDLREDADALQRELLAAVDGAERAGCLDRDLRLDEAARETMLALSSDWAFMVTRDSAADYGRDRAFAHAGRARAVLGGAAPGARRPFSHLDARALRRGSR